MCLIYRTTVKQAENKLGNNSSDAKAQFYLSYSQLFITNMLILHTDTHQRPILSQQIPVKLHNK